MTRLVLLADALFVTGVVAGVIATFMLSLSIRKHVSVDRDLLWIGSGVVFGGAIIATASVARMRANAGPPAYSASKAGVINLVQTSAYGLAGTGVRVNAICPGLIETEMTRPIYDYARATGANAALGSATPLQRGGEPEEIAAVALFLASPMASYITGQALPVCGGLSASHPYRPDRPDPQKAAEVIARYRAEQGG